MSRDKKRSKTLAKKKRRDSVSKRSSSITTRRKGSLKSNNYPNDSSDGLDSEEEEYLNEQMSRTSTYPNDVMVDFTALDTPALIRCLKFFHLGNNDNLSQDEMAALVARCFYKNHQVNEGEAISGFMQRLRNGKHMGLNSNQRSKRERRDAKKRKTSSSRKRDRDASVEDIDPISKGEDEDDAKVYCICHKPSYGDMIACDGESCPNPSEWYHLDCVGLTPGDHPDIWMCPDCDEEEDDN